MSFTSAFFLFVALRLPFRSFSRRWSFPSLDRAASFSVASATVESQVVGARVAFPALSVMAHPCHLIVFGQAFWLAVLPLTGQVIIIRKVASGGPLDPPRGIGFRVLLRGRSPTPVVRGGCFILLCSLLIVEDVECANNSFICRDVITEQ